MLWLCVSTCRVARRGPHLPLADGPVQPLPQRPGGREARGRGGARQPAGPRHQQVLVRAVRPQLPAPGHAGAPPALRVRHHGQLPLPAVRPQVQAARRAQGPHGEVHEQELGVLARLGQQQHQHDDAEHRGHHQPRLRHGLGRGHALLTTRS